MKDILGLPAAALTPRGELATVFLASITPVLPSDEMPAGMTDGTVRTPAHNAAIGTLGRNNDQLINGTELDEPVGEKQSGERLIPEPS